jgi:hypothetical protein
VDRIRYLIGLLTLSLAIAAGLFVFELLADEDRSGLFALRLEFRDVRGLKAGADVRYRGVTVGSVRDVGLSADGEKGLVTVLLEEDGARLARLSSRFWVVVPRFGGITSGATGLETLVRDAYVAFLTPELDGPELAPGSLVAGLERPFVDPRSSELEPLDRGDLRMTLLVGEKHGLTVGAAVQFRGLDVGDVRAIELAPDGGHVRVRLRIREEYRRTVTDRTAFWIARPRLSGALLGGMTVEDLGALLVPFVGYHTPGERGAPVPDGYQVIASGDRPETSDEVPAGAVEAVEPRAAARPGGGAALRLVEIVYEVEERDWLSANDFERREGTGLLFIDAAGRPVVATSRSLVDGTVFMSDTFGEPDIKAETIRVVVPGIGVLRAGRSWVDPQGADLAILVVESAPPDLEVTPAELLAFDLVPTDGVSVQVAAGDQGPTGLDGSPLPDLGAHRGAVLLVGGRAFALIGEEDGRPVRVPLAGIPDALRPGS